MISWGRKSEQDSRATNRGRCIAALASTMLCAMVLQGCSGAPTLPKLSSLNPFKEKEIPLAGKRKAVLKETTGSIELASGSGPMQLPPVAVNASWSQPGGAPSNTPGHLALSGGLKTVWRSSAGTGSTSYGRLTASPIMAEGRVYTLDSRGKVSAFSASGGSRSWSTSLRPESEDAEEGYGGGLAFDSGRLIAATGFGTVVALNPKTGKSLWVKKLGIPIRSSPTASGGRVYVVSNEGRTYALSAEDGSEQWVFRGLPQRSSMLSNASPAVSGNQVVVPYASGDLVALDIATGQPMWTDRLSRSRVRRTLATLNDAARPVVSNGVVFAVGNGGRMVATSQKNGERLWSKSISSSQPPLAAGNHVFVVDNTGRLMALQRSDGGVRWALKLPAAKTWSGPVLAGGKLWLVSNKGKLVGVDPQQGRVSSQRSLSDPVYIAPIVAAQRMFVLTDKARLVALN